MELFSPKMSSFVDNFWGEKNTGFYVLYGNMKQGQTSSKELIDFLRESCTVEENYSKLLTKLAKTAMNSNHVGTFAPFWTILKVLAEKLSTLHMQLVHSWADLIKDVNRYNEEQHRKHKSMKDAESNTMESVQSIQQTTTSLRKAREIYHTRCLEVERLKRDNASQKDIEKSEVKCKKANEEYRKLVDNYANIRNEFEEKMTESCKHFQELEEKHIHQMKDFIDTYNKSWENQHALLGQVHRECKQNCDQLSVATLMQAFITAKTTGTSKPALGNWKAWPGPIEFEEPDLSSLPPARSMSPVSLENADSLSDVKKQESNGSPSPVMSDQPGPLSRSVKLRVSRTWFLKSKNKRKEKSKKKKKDERDTESMGTTDSQESQNSPVVDADGYIIRTDNPHENNGDKNSWYTSSESDSDNDEPQKIRVEIKPLSPSGTQSTARLEDIRASVEALRLSPTATKRRSQTPVERMKRSHSVSDTLDSTKPGDNLLSLDLFATASSASTPTGGNYSNHFSLPSPMSPNIDISINSSAATTPANNSSVNELFISEVNDTSPALPNKLRQTSMSHISTTSISNFPAPPLRLPSRSKNMLPHSTARPTGRMSPASFMSRSESTSSDTFHTTPSIGSSRGPSPLTLGMSDVVPLAVAFTETVNAWFRGTDATRCMSRIHGGIMMSFPAGVIKVFTDNPCPPMLSFRLKNTARIEQVLVNKQLVIEDNVENVADSLSYSFDMAALTDHLRHQGEQSKSASYFNIDILKYQVKSDTGVEAMPLPLVCYWKCDAHHTDFRLDYKYNSSAMSTEATIKNVTMAVTMDGDVTNMQSLPSGTWSGENKRAMWKLDDISNVSEAGSQGTIRAKFNVNNGPSALSGTAVQFTCEGSTLSGVEFELLGSGYRLSLIKKRFASGKYLVEPDSDTKYV